MAHTRQGHDVEVGHGASAVVDAAARGASEAGAGGRPDEEDVVTAAIVGRARRVVVLDQGGARDADGVGRPIVRWLGSGQGEQEERKEQR